MKVRSSLNSTAEDTTSAYSSPPLPILGGGSGASPVVLQQHWAGEHRTIPLEFKSGRQSMSDSISEFRTGQIMFDPYGLTISGKAVLPAQTQLPIIVGLTWFIGLGALIAYFIMEYALRFDRTDRLSWEEVTAVLIDPPSNRACIVYHLPGKPKFKYALGLKLEGSHMEDFLRSVRPHLSGRVIERKIRSVTPLAIWILIVLGILSLVVVAFFILGIVNP